MHNFSQLRVHYHAEVISEPLSCADDCVFYLKGIWDADLINIQEQAYLLCLNSQNQVIGWRCISTGSSSQLIIDIKFAASVALGAMAAKVIIAHNHPAGVVSPSKEDIKFTIRLYQALKLLEIELADHIIINLTGYYSFKDKGHIKAA